VGELLYTYYFFAFLVAGLVLFIAMIGAIVLTLNQSQNVKRQKIYKQVLRDSSLVILKKVIK
jgi:NADH-quinone oxidoreductase subunit J